ncbi:hypothetical protein HC891_27360 [Candidatus Gracilibacteria bacterium]|nr:hypothetical protein [Candidatus Gracilibacteria bacterium]
MRLSARSGRATQTERDRYVYWGLGLLALLAIGALLLAFFLWGPQVAQQAPERPLILQSPEANAGAASQNAIEAPTVEPQIESIFRLLQCTGRAFAVRQADQRRDELQWAASAMVRARPAGILPRV